MKKKVFWAALFLLPLFAGCSAESTDNTDNTFHEYETEENTEESEVTAMYLTINDHRLEVQLAQNSSAEALAEILAQGDLSYTADDYGNFEKVGNLGVTLPRNDEQITTQPGDVILYQGSSLCLYYGVNTWSFTRIGRINGYTDEQLKTLLGAGNGSVRVTLSINQN